MAWTPIPARVFSSPAKFPLLIIARCGHVWLPIGSPSGLASSGATREASAAATVASIPACLMNSRRDIVPIGVLVDRVIV
jgi:hypothetical protein